MSNEAFLEKVKSRLVEYNYNIETSVQKSDVTTFSWVLKNVSEIQKWKKPLESEKFPLEHDPSVQFSIRLHFNDSYLHISTKFFMENEHIVTCEVEFSVLTHIINQTWSIRSGSLTIINNFVYDAPKFMSDRQLAHFSVSGSLVIRCEIYSPIFSTLLKKTVLNIPKCQLNTDFSLLLNDPSFSDFTIISKDEKFAVHRAVLAARSKVFSAIFQYDMEEKKSNTVTIGDAEPEVIAELLRFIYTDNVINIEKFPLELLELADRFDLTKLKLICANELLKSISVTSALETLIIADRHKIIDLEKLTLNFIKSRLGEIVASDDYVTFCKNHPDLLVKVLRNMA